MRTYLTAFIFLLSALEVTAQKGFTYMGLSTGWSTANFKFLTFTIQREGEQKINAGFISETVFYSSKLKPYYLKWHNTYYTGGLYLSFKLSTARNFRSNFNAGVSAGSNNKAFIWYPHAGFQENFFIAGRTQLFIGQRVVYLFNIAGNNYWQPMLTGGIKFSL